MQNLWMKPPAVPKLRPHDRLSRAEFERRYAAMPPSMKAELLNGAVYVAQPVGHVHHGRPHTMLAAWLCYYVDATLGLDVGDNSSLRLEGDNEPQPDLLLRIPTECGGRSRVDADGYLEGAPELVAEVAASSVSYDLHQKLEVYRCHGVQEYLVHRTEDAEVDWFVLRDGLYVKQVPDDAGIVRSTVFPGLWLDVHALLAGDRRAVRAAVERGVATDPGYAEFAARMRG